MQPGSLAEEAGLEPGDVILSIGPRDVASAEEAVAALREANGRVRLLIQRDGSARWVVLDRRADR